MHKYLLAWLVEKITAARLFFTPGSTQSISLNKLAPMSTVFPLARVVVKLLEGRRQ